MVDLSTLNGASLVSDFSAVSKRLDEQFQDKREQLEIEKLDAAQTDSEERSSLLRLSQLDPVLGQSVQNVLNRGDRLQTARLKRDAEQAFKFSTLLGGIPEGSQKISKQNNEIDKRITELKLTPGNDARINNLVKLKNMSKEDRALAIMKTQTLTADTKTVMDLQEKRIAKAKAEQDQKFLTNAQDAIEVAQAPFEQQTTMLETLGEQAIADGRDPRVWNDIRETIDPNQRNLKLKQIENLARTKLPDPTKPTAKFVSLFDDKGNLVAQKNALTDEVKIDPRVGKAGGNAQKKFTKDKSFLLRTAKSKLHPNGQQFTITPVLDQVSGTVKNVATLVQGEVLSPLGETPTQIKERAIETGGKVERAKRRAQIDTQADLTNVQKQTALDNDDMKSAREAAENVPALLSTLEILKRVETGGVDNFVLQSAAALGIDTADQAELMFNLRTNVLKLLKPTFGAQFTENEGNELRKISASTSKSTAGNIRLLERALQIYDRSIQRGFRAADAQKNTRARLEIEEARKPFGKIGLKVAPEEKAGGLTPDKTRRLQTLRKKFGR